MDDTVIGSDVAAPIAVFLNDRAGIGHHMAHPLRAVRAACVALAKKVAAVVNIAMPGRRMIIDKGSAVIEHVPYPAGSGVIVDKALVFSEVASDRARIVQAVQKASRLHVHRLKSQLSGRINGQAACPYFNAPGRLCVNDYGARLPDDDIVADRWQSHWTPVRRIVPAIHCMRIPVPRKVLRLRAVNARNQAHAGDPGQ
ncbi:hypothetical protein [Devosia limi]|uniref:hypothetical protein n=1 Tax=Devosia limi TaxID=288995 RepID=UPI001364D859|nr:hypothetical protein [Devosia limi]